jgi:hypothetical protein
MTTKLQTRDAADAAARLCEEPARFSAASNHVAEAIRGEKRNAQSEWNKAKKQMNRVRARHVISSDNASETFVTIFTSSRLKGVVEGPYTTTDLVGHEDNMAFVRRKGSHFYLVHNVRRGGKVRQLHLARLGERARITDRVVREVSKKHPFVELNWRALREQVNNHHVDLADSNSPAVQKLVADIRGLNLELADLFPPILRISESPVVARELVVQLRLLQSTLQVKLEQFDRGRLGSASSQLRRR